MVTPESWVVRWEEGLVNRDVHDGHARRGSVTRASPKLLTIGRALAPLLARGELQMVQLRSDL